MFIHVRRFYEHEIQHEIFFVSHTSCVYPIGKQPLERVYGKRIEDRVCFALFLVLCVLKWLARVATA